MQMHMKVVLMYNERALDITLATLNPEPFAMRPVCSAGLWVLGFARGGVTVHHAVGSPKTS